MIIKAFEYLKIKNSKNKIFLFYGENDGYKNQVIKKVFIDEFNNYILISVTTRFIRDWITSRYLDQILQIVKSYKKAIERIEFSINDKKENKVENIISNPLETNGNLNKNVSFIKNLVFRPGGVFGSCRYKLKSFSNN